MTAESRWTRRVLRAAAIAFLPMLSLAGFAAEAPAVESRRLASREGLVRLIADFQPSDFRVPPPVPFLVGPKDITDAKAAVTVNYLPAGPGEFGDTCIAWPEQPKAAFTYAANIWGSLLQSSVPIIINACWANNMESGVLGHAGATDYFRNFTGAPLTNTYYAAPLANALAGRRLGTSPDIYAAFNSAFSWYVGTDGNTPGTQHDFASVVLHEIGHGLGFSGSMDISGTQASYGFNGSALSYDRFTENSLGQSLLNTTIFPNPSVALAGALTSGTYFKGTLTNAANGGVRVPLYSPASWSGGSSYSHLAESYNNTPNALMTYSLARGESLHSPGPVGLAVLRDQGWQAATASQYTLTVAKLGGGTGTVTSSPAGVSCGTTCAVTFNSGASVTLTAAPAAGSKFTGWGGGCSGTGTCTLTMSAATTATATFAVQATLTITKSGTGTGVVSSTPAGISCGATCTGSFDTSSAVTLTATADSGSQFAGWSGACSGTGSCTVTIGSTNAVTATFNVNGGIVTVTRSGTGAGTVVSTPGGISCGSTCAVAFGSGTPLSLTATPAPGSTFAGWSGACTGTGACTFTVNGAATATAAFALQAAASLSASSNALDFGGQSLSTTSPSQAITLTNRGTAALSIASIVASSSNYGVSHNCAALAAGAICAITVTFTPQAQGALSGLLTITGSPGVSSISLSGSGERSLVTHYYRAILGRAADTGGKAYWESEATRVAALGANVNETWYAMAMSFFNSTEYQAFKRSDTDFVRDLYLTFFNRAPDAGGSTYWAGQLTAGLPREVLLVTFMFSTEFSSFTKAIFGTQTVRAEVDAVVDFYRGLLSRLPDSGGFNYWVSQFQAAQCSGAAAVYTTVEAMSAAYADSAEYTSRGRSSAQFVGDMYNAFLRRGGDLAGVQFWIGQVNTGARTRSKVRQDFIFTPEFSARVTAIINQGCRFQ